MPSGRALPPDARTFLGRLTHLDPGALVRLRPMGSDRTALWARLPWGVLVTRDVDLTVTDDVTVGAAALLAGADQSPPRHDPLPPRRDPLPPRRDAEWRWPLPPHAGSVVEEIPAARLRELINAAAGTLREVSVTGLSGRAVGARRLREALLDHVPIVVETDAGRWEVPQRLVQGVARMGFLGREHAPVRVRLTNSWVGLAARYGTAWLPPPAGPLTIRPV